MSIFSSNGFLGKIWTDIKGLFVKIEEEFLPEAIAYATAVNNALKSGLVTDVVSAINATLDGVPEKLLTAAQSLTPKILAQLLGLQAFDASATPQAATAWAQSVIDAYAGKNVVEQSGIWANLVTELVILFDQGKTTDKTWLDWANTADQALQKIQTAIAAAHQAVATSATAPASTPPAAPAPATTAATS